MELRAFPLRRNLLFAIPLVVLIMTLACGSPTQLVTINIDQSDLDEEIQESAYIRSPDGWSFLINNAEIREGEIRINGDYTPMGSGTISGNLDTVLKVSDGSLKGEIMRVNFQGFVAPDQPLKAVNDMFVQQIVRSLSEGKNQVKFESVEIREGMIKIVYRFLP